MKLKPCPFCGSKRLVIMMHGWIEADGSCAQWRAVKCSKFKGCGAQLGWSVNEQAAIKRWNTRATRTRKRRKRR